MKPQTHQPLKTPRSSTPSCLLALAAALSLVGPVQAGDQAVGTSQAGVDVPLHWGDFDGDAYLDAVLITPEGGLSLLQNRADGNFTDVTDLAGLHGISGVELVLFDDHDQDGLSDLFIATSSGTQLLLNRGFGFTDVTPATGFAVTGKVRSAHWIDYDMDGLLDLHVVTSSENVLLHSLGGRGFETIPLSAVVETGGVSGFGPGSAPSGDDGAGDDGQGIGGNGSKGSAPTVSQGPGVSPSAGLIASGGTLDARPTLPDFTSSRPKGTAVNDSSFCALSLSDAASSGCLQASSVPSLGLLYPLSVDLFVDAATGNVGMGTTAPAAKLHVEGTTDTGLITDGLAVFGPTTGLNISMDQNEIMARNNDEASVLNVNRDGGDVHIQSAISGRVGIGTSAPSTTLDINGDLTVRNDSFFDNNVGIGTSSPATKLHVEGTTDTGLLTDGLAVFGLTGGANISMDQNEIMARNNGEASALILNNDGGEVGIGTSAPATPLNLHADGNGFRHFSPTNGTDVSTYASTSGGWIGTFGPNPLHFYSANSTEQMTLAVGGNFGIATTAPAARLHVKGTTDTGLTSNGLAVFGPIDAPNISIDQNEIMARSGVVGDETSPLHLNASGGDVLIQAFTAGRVGIGTSTPATTLDVDGAITIRGGADIVESFESSCGVLEPGTVVAIDPDRPGMLMCSVSAYDTKVAGVVSGAGGVNPGLLLGQDDMFGGDTQVAMTGRVYVKCTTEGGPVRPGDRLTTSSLAGHAMRVVSGPRADGAVIGKAMSALDDGTGLVLVLVNLQ
jgi:hypothetical protein